MCRCARERGGEGEGGGGGREGRRERKREKERMILTCDSPLLYYLQEKFYGTVLNGKVLCVLHTAYRMQ